MKYKDFVLECKKGMKIYVCKNGTFICSYLFFEEDTYKATIHSKFFDRKRRLKKFLQEVER